MRGERFDLHVAHIEGLGIVGGGCLVLSALLCLFEGPGDFASGSRLEIANFCLEVDGYSEDATGIR